MNTNSFVMLLATLIIITINFIKQPISSVLVILSPLKCPTYFRCKHEFLSRKHFLYFGSKDTYILFT